jgi:molybdate transport system substrate-binding protein
MRPAFEDVIAAFQTAHPTLKVVASYGASGSFFAQLNQQAPFDLFLSADTKYPDQLVTTVQADKPFLYASGRLVLWGPVAGELGVAKRGLEALSDPKVQRISIANSELAPYGKAAEAVLRRAGVFERLSPKLVRAENVGQAAQFVQSGAAQIGFFAYSLALEPQLTKDGDAWLVPAEFHEPILQSGVILPWTMNRPAAEALRYFLLGTEGKAILERHGFSIPRQGS